MKEIITKRQLKSRFFKKCKYYEELLVGEPVLIWLGENGKPPTGNKWTTIPNVLWTMIENYLENNEQCKKTLKK